MTLLQAKSSGVLRVLFWSSPRICHSTEVVEAGAEADRAGLSYRTFSLGPGSRQDVGKGPYVAQ